MSLVVGPRLQKKTEFKIAASVLLTATALGGAVTPALANPPCENSVQMARMKAFEDYIVNTYRKTDDPKNPQFCCNLGDGRMGYARDEFKENGGDMDQLREVWVENPAEGMSHYRVHLTVNVWGDDSSGPADINKPDGVQCPVDHTYDYFITSGGKTPEGRWIDIPEEAVLSSANVEKRCKPGSKTCSPPLDNVLWLASGGRVYCYWPRQRWTKLETPTRHADRQTYTLTAEASLARPEP